MLCRARHLARRIVVPTGFSFALALTNCQSDFAPPPVTAQMTGVRGKHVDVATLQTGRSLFVSRCIECHTLPVISHYDAVAWPWLVDDMSARANLKPGERQALVAYILAARTQTKR